MFGRRLGTGDEGFTDLMGPKRVAKYDLRPETYGTLDEATSALGLARALSAQERVREIIHRVQHDRRCPSVPRQVWVRVAGSRHEWRPAC